MDNSGHTKRGATNGANSSHKRLRNVSSADLLSSSNSEMLKALVLSGFMTSKELGRFLLLTSKELKQSYLTGFGEDTDDDAIWKPILSSHCGEETATAFLDVTQLSAKACCKGIVLKAESIDPWALRPCGSSWRDIFKPTSTTPLIRRPLQYSPEDYAVTIALGGIEKIIYHAVRGQDIPDFFRTGTVTIRFDDEPLWKSSHPSTPETVRSFVCFMLDDFCFDIRIVRLCDQRIICLGQGNHMLSPSPIRDESGAMAPGGEMDTGAGSYTVNHPAELSVYGLQLLKRHFPQVNYIRAHVGVGFKMVRTNIDHDTYAVSELTLKGMFDEHEEEQYETDLGFTLGMELEAANTEPIRNGEVTFAHFLEALEWKDPEEI